MKAGKVIELATLAATCMLQTSMAQGWDPADTDADGLSDAWETAYFGNLASNGTSDNDGDTLPNSLEFSSGRNPTLAETVAGTPDWQAVPGALRYERWNGISGTTLSGLYSSPVFQQPSPSATGFYTSAEAPQNQGDNLGCGCAARSSRQSREIIGFTSRPTIRPNSIWEPARAGSRSDSCARSIRGRTTGRGPPTHPRPAC